MLGLDVSIESGIAEVGPFALLALVVPAFRIVLGASLPFYLGRLRNVGLRSGRRLIHVLWLWLWLPQVRIHHACPWAHWHPAHGREVTWEQGLQIRLIGVLWHVCVRVVLEFVGIHKNYIIKRGGEFLMPLSWPLMVLVLLWKRW